MKKTAKSLFAGLMLTATVALPQLSYATVVDISHPPQALTLLDGTQKFGAKFGSGFKNATFTDDFTFSLSSIFQSEAIVSSISSSANDGLALTGFDLLNSHGAIVIHGVQENMGTLDLWSLPTTTLGAGSYMLRVKGYMVSNSSGSFGGNLNAMPVPEPETYGMMLFGLGVVGLLARRRKTASVAA